MHSNPKLCRSLIASTLLLLTCSAQAAISEDFSNGAAGWTAVDLPGSGIYTPVLNNVTVTYSATGGSPGGHISASDPSSNSFYFNAPSAFLGNLSSYEGGKLSFDTYYTPKSAGTEWRGDADLVLTGGATTLVWQAASNPGSTWTHVSSMLAVGQGWKIGSLNGADANVADFASVLGNLASLRIRGEYVNGVVETTGLDNVMLAPVPEPETWAMLLAGLGLLGLKRRRATNCDLSQNQQPKTQA